ncbi:hypothetical protein [Streptomyces sp. NPDC012466]|uniref:hypothetical protein n=1 Tax=Streptomyces sp. NPDC012466 TaxID=3364835 RepID=UPI0036EB2DC2
MDRYVHVELRGAVSAFTGTAIAAAVFTGVRGHLPIRPHGLPLVIGIGLAFVAASALLRRSRLKGFGVVREFDTAPFVEDTGATPPAAVSLRRRPFSPGILAFSLVFALLVALLAEPSLLVVPPWLASDWLAHALVAARWERGNGLVLWRGHIPDEPWRLSVSRRPPTRTATGAPPA